MNHVITFDQLKKGDHIYRQLSTGIWGIDTCFFHHHGIVSHVPSIDPNHASILVLEMTKNDELAGIQEVTLEQFLDGRKLRIVKYNVSYLYQKTHLPGTCHTEPKSDPLVILERCNQIQRIFADINDTYSLFGINCEHFALFCVTGMVSSGIKSTQILSLLRKADDAAHCAHKVGCSQVVHQIAHTTSAAHADLISSVHVTTTHPIATSTTLTSNAAHAISSNVSTNASAIVSHATTACSKMVAKTASTIASNVSTTTTATKVVVDVIPISPFSHVRSFFQPISAGTVCMFVGVAGGLEAIVTAYEIWKYKNDVTYCKEDLIRDLIEVGITTLSIIGVGVIGLAMGLGWWVILPLFGVSVLLHYLFKKYYKDKESKEKCYNARGLTLNSSIKEKKMEVRRIKQEIKKEKLHPTHWKRDIENRILGDMPEDVSGVQKIIAWWKKWRVKKEKQKRLKNFLWLMSIKELLQHDI
eukprot:122523_1